MEPGGNNRKLYRLLILFQASYSLLTALWGLLHMDSFMKVTGPKTDVWLVKTVCLLLVAISLCLYSFLKEKSEQLPAVVLGFFTAAGLLFVDVYYPLTGRIKWVYLLDAIPEGLFCLGWILVFARMLRRVVLR